MRAIKLLLGVLTLGTLAMTALPSVFAASPKPALTQEAGALQRQTFSCVATVSAPFCTAITVPAGQLFVLESINVIVLNPGTPITVRVIVLPSPAGPPPTNLPHWIPFPAQSGTEQALQETVNLTYPSGSVLTPSVVAAGGDVNTVFGIHLIGYLANP
jgi:hypothetical protein